MIFIIPKNWHFAIPGPFGLGWRKSFTWKVKFTDSCRYDLQTEDQGDINKLTGPCFWRSIYRPAGVKWWQLWNYQHGESARFGWRYNKKTGMVDLFAYCHIGRERSVTPIASVRIDFEAELRLVTNPGEYGFMILNDGIVINWQLICFFHRYEFCFFSPIYFGGNRKAPRTMKIKLR